MKTCNVFLWHSYGQEDNTGLFLFKEKGCVIPGILLNNSWKDTT